MVARDQHQPDNSRAIAVVAIEVGEQLGIKGDTLRNWVKIVRIDDGELPGTTSADAKRIAELEKENR